MMLEQPFPEAELAELWAHLQPEFRNVGWLPNHWPPPTPGWLITPLETIPLLLAELPARETLKPVFCLCQDQWLPLRETLYARYVDVPYLVRALQAAALSESSAALRVHLFSPERAWRFSAAADDAAFGKDKLTTEEPESFARPRVLDDPSALESNSAMVDGRPGASFGLTAGKELGDWLKRWENEIGATADLSRPEVRALLHTMGLCRVQQALARPGDAPELFPPAVWRPCTGSPLTAAGDIDRQVDIDRHEFVHWRRPADFIRRSIENCPAHWLPEKARALKVLEQIGNPENESHLLTLRRMLSEWTLLSNAKFEADCFAQALCSEEELRQAWRLALTRPIHVAAATGGAAGLAQQPIEVNCLRDSPARFSEWVREIFRYWRAYVERELITALEAGELAMQADWLNPPPEQATRQTMRQHYLRGGMATSLRVTTRDQEERARCWTILTTQAMKLADAAPELSRDEENLADFWIGERST